MPSIIKMNLYTNNTVTNNNTVTTNNTSLVQMQPVIKLGYNSNKPRQCAPLYVQGNKTCSSCGH